MACKKEEESKGREKRRDAEAAACSFFFATAFRSFGAMEMEWKRAEKRARGFAPLACVIVITILTDRPTDGRTGPGQKGEIIMR